MWEMIARSLFSDPKIKAVIDEIPSYADQWKRLNATLRFLESSAQGLDNKVVFLIGEIQQANEKLTLLLSESHLTPDLHAGALAMANADPRNHPPSL